MVNTPGLWCREVLNLAFENVLSSYFRYYFGSGLGGTWRAVVAALVDVHGRLIVACDATDVGDVAFLTFSHASTLL